MASAFTSGGSTAANYNRNRGYELQEANTITLGKHTAKFGARVRRSGLSTQSTSNFNGTYTFSSLDQYRQVLAGAHVDPNDPNSPLVRATQFSINRGDPVLRYSQYEASFFVQDDMRLRPNFTLSAGLRYEFQSHLQDKLNIAPRLGIAWSPSKDRKTTIHGRLICDRRRRPQSFGDGAKPRP